MQAAEGTWGTQLIYPTACMGEQEKTRSGEAYKPAPSKPEDSDIFRNLGHSEKEIKST